MCFRIIVHISPQSFSEGFDGDGGIEHGLIVAGIGQESEGPVVDGAEEDDVVVERVNAGERKSIRAGVHDGVDLMVSECQGGIPRGF